MNKTFTTLLCLTIFIRTQAQTFSGAGGGITDNGVETYFPITVSGILPQLNGNFGVTNVCININHPDVSELYIFLISPTGITVELSDGGSCQGNSYTGTCFDNNASTSITLGSAPYTGTWRPMGYFGRFNNGENPNGTWRLSVKDWLAMVDSGSVTDWSITFGNSPPPPVNFTSSNLPIIIINTNGQPINDSDLVCNMGVIDNGTNRNNVTDTWNAYNGKIRIHWHGHNSKTYAKKCYAVETEDAYGNNLNVPLLGFPTDNDWILNAEFADKTLLRDRLTYYLANQMGDYASRSRSVEVIINGEYQGVYVFLEKPKRATARVNISKLSSTDNTYPGITGGYILKIDRTDAPGWYSYEPGNGTANHFYYQYDYPKDVDITSQQRSYIHAVMDSFELAMNGGNFADANTGYPHFIDPYSFVDYLIIDEFSKDVDAYRLSTYLYKEKITHGGKIKAGPVWDYDLAWHNANFGDAFLSWNWQYLQNDDVDPYPTWWKTLRTDDSFNNKLECRWNTFRQNVLKTENIFAWIDARVAELNEAQQRNFTQWPVLGAYIQPNPQNQNGATWQTEIQDLKNWIAARAQWMDSQLPMPQFCDTVTPPPPPPPVDSDTSSIAMVLMPPYPNPFTSDFTLTFEVTEDSKVVVELMDMVGQSMALLYSEQKTSGIYTAHLKAPVISSGLYIMKLTINNHVYLQKMMKMEE